MSGTNPEETPGQQPSWENYQQPSTPAFPEPPGSESPYGQPPYGQPPYGQSPYGQAQPGRSPYGQGLTPHPQATSAMILGIVALAGTFVCGVLCVLGPFAWVKGAKVRREIDAEPLRWSGRGEATAGYVMGIVTTVLMILGVLALISMVAIFASSAYTL